MRKFRQFLEEMGGGTGCAGVGGGTSTADIATYARPIGSPVKRNFVEPIATGYDSTFEKKKKKKSKSIY